jgi:hypothetical protein
MAYTWQPIASGPRALEDLSRMEFAGIQTNINTEAANIARDENALRNWRASVERLKANQLNAINAWRQEQQRRLETMGALRYQAKQKELEWERYGDVVERQAKATEGVRLKTAIAKYADEVEGLGETYAIQWGDAEDDYNDAKVKADLAKDQFDKMTAEHASLKATKGKETEAATLNNQLKALAIDLKKAQTALDRQRIVSLRIARAAGLKGFEILPNRGIVRHGKTKKEWAFKPAAKPKASWQPVIGDLRLAEAGY